MTAKRRKAIVAKLMDTLQLYDVRVDPDALDRRVGNLMKSVQDDDRVELTCRVIARRDKKNFRVSQSLGWNVISYVSRQLSTSADTPIPEDGWDYALWRFNILTSGELSPKAKQYAMSIDYHLSAWADATDPFNPDPRAIAKSKTMLARLRSRWDMDRISV